MPLFSDTAPVAVTGLRTVALAAWAAVITEGAIAGGQRFLIHGGAGGSIAVQLAKSRGADDVIDLPDHSLR